MGRHRDNGKEMETTIYLGFKVLGGINGAFSFLSVWRVLAGARSRAL